PADRQTHISPVPPMSQLLLGSEGCQREKSRKVLHGTVVAYALTSTSHPTALVMGTRVPQDCLSADRRTSQSTQVLPSCAEGRVPAAEITLDTRRSGVVCRAPAGEGQQRYTLPLGFEGASLAASWGVPNPWS